MTSKLILSSQRILLTNIVMIISIILLLGSTSNPVNGLDLQFSDCREYYVQSDSRQNVFFLIDVPVLLQMTVK